MGNACTHGAKKQARKMEESVGLKGGKKSETYDGELLSTKKEIETAMKTLEKMQRQIKESSTHWSTLTTGIGKSKTLTDTVPDDLRIRNAVQETNTIITAIGPNVAAVDRSEVEVGAEFVQKFLQECSKAVKMEYKMYNNARVEYDMYLDKSKNTKMDDVKRAGTETKLAAAKEEYDLRKRTLKERLDNIMKHLPVAYETAALALAKSHAAHNKAFGSDIEKMMQVAAKNETLLATTVESLNLKRDRSATGEGEEGVGADAAPVSPAPPAATPATPPAPAVPVEPVVLPPSPPVPVPSAPAAPPTPETPTAKVATPPPPTPDQVKAAVQNSPIPA